MFTRFFQLFFFDADKGSAGGEPAPDPKRDDARPRASDILDRHGSDALKLAERLATREGDNYSLREERRQLKEQLAALQGKLPGEGAVVLAGDDASTWEAYRKLGKLDELTTALTERETAKTELTTLKQDLLLRDVAQIAKYDLDVLRTIGGSLSYAIKDTTVNGKAEKQVVIVDGEKETPLSDYAKAQWAKFLPSLQLAPERQVIGSPQDRTQRQPPPAAQATAPKRSIL